MTGGRYVAEHVKRKRTHALEMSFKHQIYSSALFWSMRSSIEIDDYGNWAFRV